MSLWRETSVKATRKIATCDACLTSIPVGSPAERVVGINIEGDFIASVMHPECKAAELELNKNYDLNADEWIGLHEFDPEDEPFLLTEHPAAAARLGIAASADTHPKGGDSEAAPFMGGAVPKADAPNRSGPNP